MTVPTTPAPAAKEDPDTILVEKNIDGSGGTSVPRLKASPSCTHCFGTGYIRHGALIACPWCTAEGKAGENAWMAGSEKR